MARSLGLAFFLVLAAPASAEREASLGMTPNQVFNVWFNINEALIAASDVIAPESGVKEALMELSPASVPDGKQLVDVLIRVETFRQRLDALRRSEGLPTSRTVQFRSPEVTSSYVFVNSSHLLNALVDWLIRNTPPEQLVGRFYRRRDFHDKTLDEVYALVDLAQRRMELLLRARRG